MKKPLVLASTTLVLLFCGCRSAIRDLGTAYFCDAVTKVGSSGSEPTEESTPVPPEAGLPPEVEQFCAVTGKPIVQRMVVCVEETRSCRCDGEKYSCEHLEQYCDHFKSRKADGYTGVGTGCNLSALRTVSQGDWALVR